MIISKDSAQIQEFGMDSVVNVKIMVFMLQVNVIMISQYKPIKIYYHSDTSIETLMEPKTILQDHNGVQSHHNYLESAQQIIKMVNQKCGNICPIQEMSVTWLEIYKVQLKKVDLV